MELIILNQAALSNGSTEFTVNGSTSIAPRLVATGLAVGESVILQTKVDGTWVDVTTNGATVTLVSSFNSRPINLVGTYRVRKALTAGVVKVVYLDNIM